VTFADEGAGGAEQVVRDRGADRPRSVRGELAGGQVRQGAVDDVGQDGLDDGVLAVGDVGLRGRLGAVGQERVVPPLCAAPRYVCLRGVRGRLAVGCGLPRLTVFT
jgi:hypothetical protein